jgi:hypothetical protein
MQEERNFKGRLEVINADSLERRVLVSEEVENLFYNVPRRILCFIDCCPSMITEVMIDYDEEKELVSLCCSASPSSAKRLTIEIEFTKLIKYMENDGISKDRYLDELFADANRSSIITRAIAVYSKKNL